MCARVFCFKGVGLQNGTTKPLDISAPQTLLELGTHFNLSMPKGQKPRSEKAKTPGGKWMSFDRIRTHGNGERDHEVIHTNDGSSGE